jgi:hypothetical protein
MPHKEETTVCEFCRKGHVIQRLEDIAFRQWSDLGWISCRVAVSIDVCDVCNAFREATRYWRRPFSANMTKRRIRRGVGGPPDPAGRPLSAARRVTGLVPAASLCVNQITRVGSCRRRNNGLESRN